MDLRADTQGSRLLVVGSTRETGLGKEMTLPVREVEKGALHPIAWKANYFSCCGKECAASFKDYQ